MSNTKGQSKVSTKASNVVVDKPAATTTTQAPVVAKVDTHHEKLKATSDQIRLAHLLNNVEKSDDAELTKKVDDVLAIVQLVSRDDVIVALHECNYNVAETIEYLFDHNNETQNEWTTVGQNTEKTGGTAATTTGTSSKGGNKNDINNNTTHNYNENDKNNHRQRRNNTNSTRGGGGGGGRGGSAAGGGMRRTNGGAGDNRNKNNKQENSTDNSNLVNNENGNSNTTVETNGHNRNSYGNRNGRGGGGGGARGGPRGAGAGSSRQRPQSQPQAQQQQQQQPQQQQQQQLAPVEGDVNTNRQRNTNNGNNSNNVRKRNNGDNMRDIGTWSNEQASQQNKQHSDEWDNQEEEWQGDLSKTQIFTSSSVQKQLESQTAPVAGEHQTKIDIDKLLHREETRSFNTDFPIGHFNAEEASQQIKNAIGLKTVEPQQQQQQQAQTQQHQQQKPAITKLPSVKPPPPSTKIPKSAVIMPGDTNTNSYRVDVEFGLDFGQDVDNTAAPLQTNVVKKDNVVQNKHQTSSQQQQQQAPVVANLLNDKRINTVAPTQQQLNVNKPPETQRPQQQQQQQNVNPVAPLIQQQQQATEQLVNATKNLDLNKQNFEQQQQQQVTSKPASQQQPFSGGSNQSNSNLIYNTSIQQQHAHQYKQQPQQQQQQPQQKQQMQFNNSNDSYSSIPQRAVADVNKDSHMNVSPLQKQPQQPGPQMLNNQGKPNPATTAAAATAAAAAAATTMAPPPGVNLLNPNNQYLMSLPYHVFYEQNLPYFDQNQFDMIYNNPSLSQLAPSQLPTSTVTQTAGNYTMSDTKMNRPDGLAGTTTTNAQQAQTQQQQQQQHQTINYIPNYPFFLQNMYPNMILQTFPNAPQTNPQFPNKPYNFNSYDEHGQSKDYQNYATQTQSGKSVNAAMPNLNDLNVNYAKQLDKQQTNAAGYHTPPPNQSTYTNQLINQAAAAAVAGAGQPPYAYMQPQMMGQPGGGQALVLPNMQDTSRTNNGGLQQQQAKQQQNKSVYPTNSNSWA